MPASYVERMLGDNERIVHTARQHWFVLLRSILVELVFIAAIAVASGLAAAFYEAAWLGLVFLLIPLASLGADLLNWANRQYIITNRRVIQVTGVFNKNVTDSSLEKVTDLKLVQSALGRLLNYGDIEILTASELGVNLFQRIAEPIKFKTAMLNAKEKMGQDEGRVGMDSGAAREAIPDMIAQLDSLRQRGVLTEDEFARKKADLLAKM